MHIVVFAATAVNGFMYYYLRNWQFVLRLWYVFNRAICTENIWFIKVYNHY